MMGEGGYGGGPMPGKPDKELETKQGQTTNQPKDKDKDKDNTYARQVRRRMSRMKTT